MIFIDFSRAKNCKQLEKIYGEICIKCNFCGRFNKKCIICKKILKPGDKVITIEFRNIFCDFACKEHELIFKNFNTFDGKYDVPQYKKDFLKSLKELENIK